MSEWCRDCGRAADVTEGKAERPSTAGRMNCFFACMQTESGVLSAGFFIDMLT